MTIVREGDRVKVTIEGKVSSEELSNHSFCRKLTDDSGTHHFVYFDGVGGAEVEVIQPEENFTVGQAYKSALGYTYIRTRSGWVDEHATRSDDYPKRPMVPLAPEVTITEDMLKSHLRLVFASSGDYAGRISRAEISRLVAAVKKAGVKVEK